MKDKINWKQVLYGSKKQSSTFITFQLLLVIAIPCIILGLQHKEEIKSFLILNEFKKETAKYFEQCVGVIGSIDYNYFTSSKDDNMGVIEVTLKKNEDTYLLQYLYNKTTKIRSKNPSFTETNGDWWTCSKIVDDRLQKFFVLPNLIN